MSTTPHTSRRAFLKSGVVVAAPLAVVPVAALAQDESAARLARLEDQRQIEGLHRDLLRTLNGSGDCGRLRIPAAAVDIDAGLRAIAEDPARDAALDIAGDGRSAHSRHPCLVELDTDFDGHGTLEQMHRLQGHGSHRHSESRVLQTAYAKGKDGWQITGLTLV